MFTELIDCLADFLAQSYGDPRFGPVALGAPLLAGGAFLLLALPYTLLDFFDPLWARPFRLGGTRAQRVGLIFPSLRMFGLNFVIQVSLAILLWPLLAASGIHMGDYSAWWVIAAQLIGALLLDDAAFYVYHRLLHRPRWFRKIHVVHHRVRTPVALSGALMHPAEGLVISLGALAGPILFGMHIHVLFIWILLRQLIAVEGHCGYNFPLQILRLFPFHAGAHFHFEHHANNRGSLGLFFNWWDRAGRTRIRARYE